MFSRCVTVVKMKCERQKLTETRVRRGKSGRVDVSGDMSVLNRSVFRDAGDVFSVRRDVEKVRIDVEVTFLGIFVLILTEA